MRKFQQRSRQIKDDIDKQRHTSRDVGKFRLFFAVGPSKGAGTLAVGLPVLVLQADSLKKEKVYENKIIFYPFYGTAYIFLGE